MGFNVNAIKIIIIFFFFFRFNVNVIKNIYSKELKKFVMEKFPVWGKELGRKKKYYSRYEL